MKSLCRAILVLNVLYCLLAAAQEGLPGWHMFETVDRLDPVTDRDGRPVDIRAVLPANAWLTQRSELGAIVQWICRRDPSRAPFRYGDRVMREDCEVPRARR